MHWIIVDTGKAASTTPNMDPSDYYQTTYDSKTKIVVFYSLSITMLGFPENNIDNHMCFKQYTQHIYEKRQNFICVNTHEIHT